MRYRDRGGQWYFAADGELYTDPATIARVKRVEAIARRVAERRRQTLAWREGRPDGERGR